MAMTTQNLSLFLHAVSGKLIPICFSEITAKLQNVTAWLNELNSLFKQKNETFIKLIKTHY